MKEIPILDPQGNEEIQRRIERMEELEAIRAGIAAAQAGHLYPARTALAQLQEKLGFSS